MKIILIGITLLFFTGTLMAGTVAFVPLKKIVEKPKSFNRKKVQTIGKINLEFENQELSVIFCGPVNPKLNRGIWVDTSKIDLTKFDNLSHVSVKVVGVFDSKDKGHMDMYSGTLTVQSLEILKPDSKEICK